jgi:purine-binding chemotaxis protein CheW
VREVHGVIPQQRLTRVPLAPPALRGLMNLRGAIVPGIDLRRRLNLAERPGRDPWTNVIVQSATGPVSLLIDEIGDVVDIAEDALEPPPETLSPGIREVAQAACHSGGEMLILLDADKTVELSGRSELETGP